MPNILHFLITEQLYFSNAAENMQMEEAKIPLTSRVTNSAQSLPEYQEGNRQLNLGDIKMKIKIP